MSKQTSNTTHQVKTKLDKFDQLKHDSAKCRIKLITKKELIKGEVTRLKKDIRNITWLEENGLSPQNLLIGIDKSYDKLVIKLADLVDDWQSFITLTASSKEPDIHTNEDRANLKKDIAEEIANINDFKDMVDSIKFENMDLFAKIGNLAKTNEESSQLINEIELKPELRPITLNVNSTFIDVKIYIRDFTKYIQSRENTNEIELIFDVASSTIDHYWRMMLEKGWKFDPTTTLREFCFMVDSIAKERFSITNIRKELFDLKQQKNENVIEFLEKINQLMQMADWQNISGIEAICLIFISGVTCENSRRICSNFIKKTPEGDINKLRDQLEVVNEISKREPEVENCTICGKIGHKYDKCWGKCPICASYNHFPGSCQDPAKTKKQKRRIDYRKRRKMRLRLNKSNQPGGNVGQSL